MITFDPVIAKRYGIIEAIVYERIRIIQDRNEANCQFFFRDKYWAEINDRIYKEFLSFIKEGDLEFAIANLQKQGIIDIRVVDSQQVYSISIRQY